ncbi:MAG: hypothetical protein KIT58_21520 [Planctomycetota bacterium]|nr:hypothetical protein [Planctomycetota bacterium]
MSETQRKAILEAAAKDRELVELVPPVVAAGFGVLPLRRLGDVLTVACMPRASRRALRLLRDVLGLEIVAAPFEAASLRDAIEAAYFQADATVNFPTFRDPDFLDDPRSAEALRREKVERPAPAELAVPPDRLALVTLCYRSTLSDLDGARAGGALPDPRRTRLDLGALDVAWARRGDRVQVHVPEAPEGLPPAARVALTEFRQSDYRHGPGGTVGEHAVRAHLLTALPHLIHPTEVQLVQVDADGALGLHVYDRTERVAPGERRRLELAYCFLSYGSRLRRTIAVDVEEVGTVARTSVDVHNQPAPWGVTELGRWLGVSTSSQECP